MQTISIMKCNLTTTTGYEPSDHYQTRQQPPWLGTRFNNCEMEV